MLGADLARILDRARALQEQWGDKFVSAEHLLQARVFLLSRAQRPRDLPCSAQMFVRSIPVTHRHLSCIPGSFSKLLMMPVALAIS